MKSNCDKPLTERMRADGSVVDLQAYERAGGYQAIRKVLRSGMTPMAVAEEVKQSNLRGRGGAGFQTGVKWSFVPRGKDVPNPTYLVVNGDEMEPGTFKDRVLMERDPHQLIEGAMVAGFAIEADIAYIFLRGEYTLAGERLARAIAEAYERHYLGKNIFGSGYSLELYLHLSGGRYICGDETGLLNALEGKRANPRSKPPFPPSVGLFGKPTVVNNVETLCCVPHIINRGATWFQGLGRTKDGGTKLFGVSGKVKHPGLWELPMGRSEVSRIAAGWGFDRLYRRRAPGLGHGFCVPRQSRQPHGHWHHDRARRPYLPCWHDLEPDALFRARILRFLHALLERTGMGRPHSEGNGRGPRQNRRSREA
jgi:NADH-quinone oxidoreductase subunit F